VPAWAVRIGIAVADALGLTDLARAIGGIILVFVVFALLAVVSVMLAPFALGGALAGGATTGGGVQVPPALGFWATGLVAQDAAAANVPAALVLAVMDQESGGDWTASHRNGNGTTDAGLMQVNSANWTAYGLGSDPYAPASNVRAGVAILAADLAGHPGNVGAALEAYNAGPGVAGRVFDPGYAGAVLADVQTIEAGPHLAAAPLALPAVGAGRQAIVITAFAPFGRTPQAFDGQKWPGLVPPRTMTATAGGQAVTLWPLASAPAAVRILLPQDASGWVAAAPAGQPVTATATWVRALPQTYRGPHGGRHTRIVQQPVTLMTTAQ
jgi:hypothetical protein